MVNVKFLGENNIFWGKGCYFGRPIIITILYLPSNVILIGIYQARFSNAGKFGKDDRAISVRGALLKLNIGREEMDLLFNTGSTSVFENYLTFAMNAQANQALESTPQKLAINSHDVELQGGNS